MFRKFSNPLFKCNYWLFIIQTCNHSMVTSIVYYYYPSATMDVHILDFYFLFFYITYLTLFNHSHYIWNIHFLDPLSHQHDQNFSSKLGIRFLPSSGFSFHQRQWQTLVSLRERPGCRVWEGTALIIFPGWKPQQRWKDCALIRSSHVYCEKKWKVHLIIKENSIILCLALGEKITGSKKC